MKEGQYVVIQAFMVNDLNLKGNELIVYAAIFGFTQDGDHWFYGTKAYLAEWCGATKGTVGNCLKSLVEKGLIERREFREQGQTKIEYRATKIDTPPYKNCDTPHTKIDPIDNLEIKPSKEKKERKQDTFDTIIDGFTDNEELRDALREFLRYRVASAHRSKKEFTNQALRLNLTKLSKLSGDPETMVGIVNQTIEKGWSGFFKLDEDDQRGRLSEYNYR